jgi:hypothetical protein
MLQLAQPAELLAIAALVSALAKLIWAVRRRR